MVGSINKVILLGNVGKDPIIRTMSNDADAASFSLATSATWKDRTTGERREKIEWHHVAVYNSALVNIVKRYVKKGTKLYIEGTLQTRKWNDQNSNVERYTTEIILQFNANLVLLGNASLSTEGTNENPEEEDVEENVDVDMLF